MRNKIYSLAQSKEIKQIISRLYQGKFTQLKSITERNSLTLKNLLLFNVSTQPLHHKQDATQGQF